MDRLEVPPVFSGFRIDGNDGVREQIVAFAISTVVGGCRRAKRHVDDAAQLVDGHLKSPDIHTRTIFPAVGFPGFVADFARPWHRMEVPNFFPIPNVKAARIPWRPKWNIFADSSADHRDILVYGRNATIANRHVDFAVVSECCRSLSGDGVQRNQPPASGEQNTWWMVSIAGTVSHSPLRCLPVLQLVAPDFFSSFRFQCKDAIPRSEIHHPIHDNWSDFSRWPPSISAWSVHPGLRQPRDIRCVDL